MAMTNGDSRKFLDDIFEEAIKKQASDIHLSPGRPPILRIDSHLTPLTERPVLTPQFTEDIGVNILPEEKKQQFTDFKDVDFSIDYKEKIRCRINMYWQLKKISLALRVIPTKIRTIDELDLPETYRQFSGTNQGFFLVVGPAGQGKSAALAALIEEINATRCDHVITIEDPIEYLFEQKKCIIDQREVGDDVLDFHRGLREILRQDPDVIFIGEMRDPETISSAVTAAETGHFVLATLHTNTASQTIDRIIDSFLPHQQAQIRMQLADTIVGVLSRRLLPKIGGGVINAIELMIANSAIKNLIREGKVHQVNMVIETSSEEGMISLNRSLADLVKQGLTTLENAERFSTNLAELRLLLR